MQIVTAKTLPSAADLVNILQKEFSPHYSYKLFGLGQKSILVGKSTLVGAQISLRANEITIQASYPSILGGILTTLGLTELGVLLFPLFFQKDVILMKKESSSIFSKRLNHPW